MYELFTHISKNVPVQLLYGSIAITGGMARYLNGYANGARFQLSILIASSFVAGFSGWMFALIGTSVQLPQPMLFMMAGTGGFFGEQTMKFILEWTQKRIK